MNKEKQTYKVKHPAIKEIKIGDQFILNNGEIVTFVELDSGEYNMWVKYKDEYYRPFIFKSKWSDYYYFNFFLNYDIVLEPEDDNDTEYVVNKYPSLKDKVDLL